MSQNSNHSIVTKMSAVSFICLIILGNIWFVERFFADEISEWINQSIQVAVLFTLLSIFLFVVEKATGWKGRNESDDE